MDRTRSSGRSAGLVLTVTLNPALDVSMSVDRLVPDQKLRAEQSRREAGGGGVNVSRVLHRFDIPTRCFVVAGGATGAELVSMLSADDLDVRQFPIDATTRESIAITEASTNRQYRISVPGPTIGDPDRLRLRILDEATGADLVVVSGSSPPGLPTDFVARIVTEIGANATTIVDTSGPSLAAVAASSATIVKPSQRELAELVGWEPRTADDVERAALDVLQGGDVGAVVASRGPTGALLAVRDQRPRWFSPPPVRPRSTVGAGDSMVAGIAASLAGGHDIEDAVRFGVAAGTAAVLSPGSGLCERADVEQFVDEVMITSRHADRIV